MKVVKRRVNGKIVYLSDPKFEEGFGIKNAIALEGGLPEDYEEVEILESEWEAHVNPSEEIKERKIQAEMLRLLREQAISSLKLKGEITD